jgi:RimJ/RimL family protein N-acetyltransferase
MAFLIEPPTADDAAALGRMQLMAWLQTYPNEDAGIDEAWIKENVGSVTTAEDAARWQDVLKQAEQQPNRVFCRIVRSDTGIVGFICGSRDDVVTLGPMYLLDEVKGQGVAGRLMSEFLAWSGDTPMRLWVTAYNERAIRFYARYGFKTTGERELWRGKLPNVRMTRN